MPELGEPRLNILTYGHADAQIAYTILETLSSAVDEVYY